MKKNINFKQEFKDFLKDESGKMTQGNILKLSLTALGSLFFMSGVVTEARSQDCFYGLIQTENSTDYDDYEIFPEQHVNHDSEVTEVDEDSNWHASIVNNEPVDEWAELSGLPVYTSLGATESTGDYDDYSPWRHLDHVSHDSKHDESAVPSCPEA